MKKLLVLLLCLFSFSLMVYGSTNTYDRTDSNLRIPKKIKYKEEMYESILNTPSVKASEKIYDFADLFTEDEEAIIYNMILDYINNTNFDIAILTINSNLKNSTIEYADDFYDYNDFKIDGVLFIIDMQNREFYISTSGTAMLYYDDNRIEYILSSMNSNMYKSYYLESIKELVSNLTYYFNIGLSDVAQKYEVANGKIVYKTPYLLFLGIGAFISGIVILVLCKKNKQVKLATHSNEYLNNYEITNKEDKFITSHTNRTYIGSSDSSSGGSIGGSGSFHSGSSGMSHGGGGHKF